MNKPSRGLGRGLDELFGGDVLSSENKENIKRILLKDIVANQFQPRKDFDEAALEELKASILRYGVLQPVLVRKTMHGYELIAGERRMRASALAGLTEIPAIVCEYTDAEITEIALIENLQREDLNPIEEAAAYERLLKNFALTQEDLAQKVGKSRSHIANYIRLLHLPNTVQQYVSRETLSMGQAKPLLALPNEEIQLEAAEYIIAEDLSARASEELVKILQTNPYYIQQVRKNKEAKEKLAVEVSADAANPGDIFSQQVEERLKLVLGTQVKIKTGKKKSKLEIEFYSPEELEQLVAILEGAGQAAAAKQVRVLKV